MFVRGDIKQEFNLKMALTSPCDGIRKGFLSSQNLINLYMVFGLARQTPPPPPTFSPLCGIERTYFFTCIKSSIELDG